MPKSRYLAFTALAALLASGLPAPSARAKEPLYTLAKTVPLGGVIKWDYLHFDPDSDRVFISHGTELTVVDARTGKMIGHVTGLTGSHGIAIDHANGLGYADSGKTESLNIFDLKTLKTIKTIPALLDADGMAFDAPTAQVFIAGGDANAVLAVDTKTNEPARTIPLGGAPEFLVADDAGSLFVNINDKNEIVKIDTKTDAITARWPVAPCVGPTGLAIDAQSHRLFSSCENATMMVVDSDTGKIIATLPIGKGTDAAGFDPARKLAFSSNRDGTLTVIQEADPDHFTVLGNVATEPGARTMAIDPSTGDVFLVTARVQSAGAPKQAGGPPSYKFAPGTVTLLIYRPTASKTSNDAEGKQP
jgi:DNA-binding beta-propeller fold protein YncE